MKRRYLMAVFALMIGVTALHADLPRPWWVPRPDPMRFREGPHLPPDPDPQTTAKLVIDIPSYEGETHLRFPGVIAKQALSQVQPAERHTAWRPTTTATLIAGVALSLAFVCGGLWLVRGGRRRWLFGGGSTLVLVLVVAGLTGCPRNDTRDDPLAGVENIPAKPLAMNADGTLSGEALLEVDEKTDEVHLMVNRSVMANFLDKQANGAANPR